LEIGNWKLKIVCANLPYLTPAQIKNSPSIRYEPKLALAAGPDGLRYYRHLFRQIRQAKMKNVTILCEIDPSQKVSIKRLAKKLMPSSSIELKKDLRGHSRLAIIKIA
jgi:release factor glutamine methyltransferase